MNIEEIMRPYYEAKEEIKKEVQIKKSQNKLKIEQLNSEKILLQLRLQRLVDKKEKEIDDYILSIDAREYSYNPNYIITKKRELELEYEKYEQDIKNQINEIDKELETINEEDYSYLLYDKRLPGIREVARAQAARLVMELEVKLESKTLELQLVDLDIKSLRNRFYSWQMDEAMVELQPYYQTKDRILREIEELKKLIEQVKYESNLLYNDDELNEILSGNIEKMEKFLSIIEDELVIEEPVQIEPETVELEQEELSEPIKLKEELEEIDFGSPIPENEEEIEALEQVRQPLEPRSTTYFEDGVVDFEYDNVTEMLNSIFDDIMSSAKELRTVKLDGTTLATKDSDETEYQETGDLKIDEHKIKLPNGVYLNKDDFETALDNYYKKEKGNTYKVKNFDSVMTVTSEVINSVKESLRECSILNLMTKKILGIFDIKRVYGKAKAESYDKKIKLGSVKSKLPAGDYVNLNELVAKLGTTFAEKSQSWIEKLKNSTKDFFEKKQEEETFETPDLGNIDLNANLPYDDIKKVNIDEQISQIPVEKDDFVPIQELPKAEFVPFEYLDSSSIGNIDFDADMDFDDIKKINLGKIR